MRDPVVVGFAIHLEDLRCGDAGLLDDIANVSDLIQLDATPCAVELVRLLKQGQEVLLTALQGAGKVDAPSCPSHGRQPH